MTKSADQVYDRLKAIYQEAPKKRAQYLARTVVAKNVIKATKPSSAVDSVRPVVQYLAELRDPSIVKELLDNFLEYHESAGAPHAAAGESQPAADVTAKSAAEVSIPPRDQILEAAKARKEAELKAEAEMEDAKKEMEAALDQGIGIGNDAIKEKVVKQLVDALLDHWGGEFAAHLKETVTDYLSDVTEEYLEKLGEKWLDRIVDRFEKLFPKSIKGETEIAAQFEKTEMAKLEDLTQQAFELNGKSTDYSPENSPQDELKRMGKQKAALESSAKELTAANTRLTLLLQHGGSATMPAGAGGNINDTVASLMSNANKLIVEVDGNRRDLETSEARIQKEHPDVEKVGERKVPEFVPHPGG